MTKVMVEDGIDLWSDRGYKFTEQGAKNNYLIGSIVMVGGIGSSRPYKGKSAHFLGNLAIALNHTREICHIHDQSMNTIVI